MDIIRAVSSLARGEAHADLLMFAGLNIWGKSGEGLSHQWHDWYIITDDDKNVLYLALRSH